MGWAALSIVVSVSVILCTVLYDSRTPFKEFIEPYSKTLKRSVTYSMLLIMIGSSGKLLPSQKDMILIASGTAAYKAVTSEAGKDMTSKAYDAIMRKLETEPDDEPWAIFRQH